VGRSVRVSCRLSTVLLALSSLASAQPSEVFSPYPIVVRRYASGDREGAVVEMSGWADSRIRQEFPVLDRDGRKTLPLGDALRPEAWREMPVTAALMLHTDCALRARREGRPPRIHETAARSIAHMLKDDPAHRVFARRWYEALAEVAQAEYRLVDALEWAARGLEDFPDSGELLLVVGSIEEFLAAQAARSAPPPSPEVVTDTNVRRDRSELRRRVAVREHLEKARRAFRAALTADPHLPAAHLRLGRVAWNLGETAEARAELRAALAGSTGGATAFLARLFLGRVDEDAGHLDEAASSYEAALAIDARGQSARLALSEVRLRQGDEAAARREVEETLRPAGGRLRPDPFWLYPQGPSLGVEERLDVLRREASSS
jgi:tetratricopeptide (TPR) repeat protein